MRFSFIKILFNCFLVDYRNKDITKDSLTGDFKQEKTMKVEILDLTEKNLKDVPEWKTYPFSCKYCLYWELPREYEVSKTKIKEDLLREKLRWIENTRKNFGNCGKLLYLNGIAVGYAQYAPPDFFPRLGDYRSDAVLISCLFIPYRDLRGVGLGTQLLHSIIEDLRKRGIKAVETYARKGNSENPSGPVEFYLKNGFRIHREDPEFPLMRLDL